MVSNRAIRDVHSINRLWVHEVQRVFYDRLKTPADRKWCSDLLLELSLRYFRVEHEEKDLRQENLVFSTLMSLEGEYESVKDMEKLKGNLEVELGLYNKERSGEKVDFVFFSEAVMQLLKLTRKLG